MAAKWSENMLLSLKFEEVYDVCGGCMYLLEIALDMYLLTDGKRSPQS